MTRVPDLRWRMEAVCRASRSSSLAGCVSCGQGTRSRGQQGAPRRREGEAGTGTHRLEWAGSGENVPVAALLEDVVVGPDPVESVAVSPGEGEVLVDVVTSDDTAVLKVRSREGAALDEKRTKAFDVAEDTRAVLDDLLARQPAEDALEAVEAGVLADDGHTQADASIVEGRHVDIEVAWECLRSAQLDVELPHPVDRTRARLDLEDEDGSAIARDARHPRLDPRGTPS